MNALTMGPQTESTWKTFGWHTLVVKKYYKNE